MKSNLTLIFVGALLVAGNAHADTLALQGTVAPVNTLSVAAAGPFNALAITSAQTATVANVTETSNDLNGYIVTMASANGGQLRNAADATKQTTYTIGYNGTPAVVPTVAAQNVKTVSSLSGLTTASSAVVINVTAYSTAPAGTYSDTLTFAIVAN
jgi:hypothetical protein